MLEVLARIIADQIERERSQRRTLRLQGEASAGQALLAALKARERYTAEHSEAVVELATAVAEQLGLSEEQLIEVAQVALLHDVGKLGVPESILQKPGALNAAEWRIMRSHSAIGERVVCSIASLAHLAPAVRAEHERWDGTGYPDGLAGCAIPLASRICLACDAWHAMTSDRPYRPALSPAAARAELERHAGTQFCPRTVDALLAVLDGGSVQRARRRRRSALRAGAARVRAARADRRRRRGGSRPPARGRARGRRRGDLPRRRRLVGVDQPLGARARPRPDADQRRRARPRRGALPGRPRLYDLADYPLAARLLSKGESYVISGGDEQLGPHDRQLLDALDKGSYIGVPVIFDGRTWGKLEAFANVGAMPFTRRHVPVPGGDRRSGRRRDRARGAVLARQRRSPTRTRSPASATAARSTSSSSPRSSAAARSRSRSATSTGSS